MYAITAKPKNNYLVP